MSIKEEKVIYELLLTKDEERILKEILKQGIYSIAWAIISKAYERGDFNKK